jgi:hypothetical protein
MKSTPIGPPPAGEPTNRPTAGPATGTHELTNPGTKLPVPRPTK